MCWVYRFLRNNHKQCSQTKIMTDVAVLHIKLRIQSRCPDLIVKKIIIKKICFQVLYSPKIITRDAVVQSNVLKTDQSLWCFVIIAAAVLFHF